MDTTGGKTSSYSKPIKVPRVGWSCEHCGSKRRLLSSATNEDSTFASSCGDCGAAAPDHPSGRFAGNRSWRKKAEPQTPAAESALPNEIDAGNGLNLVVVDEFSGVHPIVDVSKEEIPREPIASRDRHGTITDRQRMKDAIFKTRRK